MMMVEKTILDAEDYTTRAGVFAALPRKMDYQAFLEVMEYLANSGKIIFDGDGMVLWVGVESPAFRAMLDRCVKIMP